VSLEPLVDPVERELRVRRAGAGETPFVHEIGPAPRPVLVPETLFSLTYDFEGFEEALERLRSTPLWSRLPAVQNGRVFTMDGFAPGTSAAGNEYAINEIAEDLEGSGR
jgi:ABC-type Fe3+-hydroxamate transport system substrate-binding protein